MNKICDFLKEYYTDNGISDKKSLIAFKFSIKKNNNQISDYIINELKSSFKTCLTDIEIIETSKKTSIRFEYKSNICEIYMNNIKNGSYLYLEYY
jgi:hypothetical protein